MRSSTISRRERREDQPAISKPPSTMPCPGWPRASRRAAEAEASRAGSLRDADDRTSFGARGACRQRPAAPDARSRPDSGRLNPAPASSGRACLRATTRDRSGRAALMAGCCGGAHPRALAAFTATGGRLLRRSCSVGCRWPGRSSCARGGRSGAGVQSLAWQDASASTGLFADGRRGRGVRRNGVGGARAPAGCLALAPRAS